MGIKGKLSLIIDDDPAVRALAAKVLEGIGFEVMEASGVIEALRLVKERIPHLILLDLNMPEVNGFSFLKMTNQNNKLHDIPVIVFSADSRDKIILKAIEMGASDYLVKPLNAKIMIQKIRRIFLQIKQSPKFHPLINRVSAKMSVDIDLLKLCSKECEIDGPVKFSPMNGLVHLQFYSMRLEEGENFLCRIESSRHSPGVKGRYISQCIFQGMPDKNQREIAQRTKGWRCE